MLETIKKLFNKFSEEPLLKSILILLSGNLLGQVINLLCSPLITRIYSPEEFSYFGIFTSFVNILTGITTLKMELSLPLKSDNQSFKRLFSNLLTINLINSVLVSLMVIGFLLIFKKFDGFFNLNPALIILLMTLSLIFTGVNRIFNNAVVKYKAYKEISKSFINQTVVKNFIQIVFGLIWAKSYVLIVAMFINQITSIQNLINILNKNNVNFRITKSFYELYSTIKSHKDYATYGTLATLVNSLGLYLPVPLIMLFFGSTSAGIFSFTLTFISLPMRMIGMSVAQVFLGEASEIIRQENKKLFSLYYKLIKKLFLISILPSIIGYVISPVFFNYFFGEEWHMIGYYIQALIFFYTLQFISSPLSQILNLLNKQGIQLLWDILRLLITFATLYLGYSLNMSILETLYIFSAGGAICYIIQIIICVYTIRVRDSKIKLYNE